MDGIGRVLVTGASGFVGSHLVEALRPGASGLRALVRSTSDVRLLDDLGVERVIGGLHDPESLAGAMSDVDVVFHLAAATRAGSPAEYESVNVRGTGAVVEALLRAEPRPRRLVYLSSLAAVGPSPDRPVRPDDPPRPLTEYGRSKLGGERVALGAQGGTEVVVLRPPAVYGPRERDLLTFFRFAARGIMPVAGEGTRRLQFIHVRDLADALIRAAEAPRARGIYHVAEPQAYQWNHVARLIGKSVGRNVRLVPVPRWALGGAATLSEGLGRVRGKASIFNRDKVLELLAPGWECDVERAADELDFEARTPLGQGLAETAAWYRGKGWL